MTSLLDIAVAKETVHGVEFRGITASDIIMLFERFPEIRKIFAGRTVDEKAMLTLAADAIGAIIAASAGKPRDAEYEAHAAALPLEIQADILTAAWRLTLPGGAGPFMAKLERLGLNDVAAVVSATGAGTKSP